MSNNQSCNFNKKSWNKTTSGNNSYNLKINDKAYSINIILIVLVINSLSSLQTVKELHYCQALIWYRNGTLSIELPRNIIDLMQRMWWRIYSIADVQYTAADETTNKPQVRTLAIDFDNDTEKIEIAVTEMVPEFGSG